MAESWRISRRHLLRGLGAAVALPWMNAMDPRRALASAASSGPPVRLAYFYVPNGVVLRNWKPLENGPFHELPPILKALEPVKQHVTVISNLAADHCTGKGAGHEPAGGGFLVGGKCKHSEEPQVAGASVDQVAASHIGLSTPVDSLALGIDPGIRGDHGYSGTYLSHISWRGKSSPAALEINPKQLFDRLFRDNPPREPNWREAPLQGQSESVQEESLEQSVLDLVREDTRDLQRKLGFSDRRKLEEYLEGLRSVERRIELASRDGLSHHGEAFKDAFDEHNNISQIPNLIIPEGRGIPTSYAEHVNLILDILTLAFQTDTTRVATFMFSYEKSGRAYPEINASGSHHSTSHHGEKADKLAELTRINTHHIELFARMLQRMASISEGERSLLDNVMICYGAGISDGNKHNHDNLPVLVAGGAGGTLQGGQHLILDRKVPICNLYVDMLNRAGIATEGFGDSDGRLAFA